MSHSVEHDEVGLGSSIFKGFPLKVMDHFRNGCGLLVVVCYKSGCSSLNFFFDFLSVWIPNCGAVFYYWSDVGLVGFFFDRLWAIFEVSSDEM